MADEPDYYAVLHVAPDADPMTIRLAYRRLARRYHPDVVGEAGALRMKALNVAYQVLSDPEERRRYDLRRGFDRARAAPPSRPSRAPTSPPSPPPTSPTSPTAPPSRPRPAGRPASRPRAAPARRGVVQQSGGPLRLLATLETPEPIPIAALAFAGGGLLAGLGLLDGRVVLHDLRAAREMPAPPLGADAGGVLQELRLAPSGAFAAVWGLGQGMRVWRVGDGASLWQAAISAPSGLMDGALLDATPSAPPILRLAVPDAPLALAADDPFGWAVAGGHGTAVYTRPLGGPVSPAFAIPLRCDEARGGGLLGEVDRGWRVRHRALSADGRHLFTLSIASGSQGDRGLALALWDLEARTLLGAPTVKRIAHLPLAEGALTFPIAASPDLAWVAASDFPVGVVLLSLPTRMRRGVSTGPVRPQEQLALSPDAAYLAVARDERLELWDTHSGQRAQEMGFAAEVTAVAFATGAARATLGVGLANGLAEVWG